MKCVVAILVLGLVSACVGYQPDQRVVGRFEASAGEAIVIRSDGRIHFHSAGEDQFVGLVTTENEEPISIRVIAPDTSPLVGTIIKFSADRQHIVVDWPSWQRASGLTSRPTEFHAK